MPDIVHNTLAALELHEPFHFPQTTDPGAVGAGKYWLDTSVTPHLLNRRNAANTGWTAIGSSGGGVTVQDEGSTLSTTASALNFVGAGVTATGTGATKLITIPGGGGSSGGLGNWYDVKQAPYNATGNGATDDRAAINSAITDANSAGGGVVFLPTGNYRITAPLLLRSNVTVRGVGPSSRIVLANGVLAHCIVAQVAGINGWRVELLQIDGNKANNAPGAGFLGGFGITLNNVGSGTISHCYIHDTVNGAVYIDGGLCTVEHCIVENIGRRGTDASTFLQIIGRSGIVFDPFAAAFKGGNRALFNQLLTVMEHGIKFYPDNFGGQCIGNRVVNNASDGDDSAFSIYVQGADRTRVVSNYIEDTSNSHYEVGIYIGDATYPNVGCTIGDNIVIGSRDQGMLVFTTSEHAITGNVIRNCPGNGLSLNAASFCAVTGNVLRNNGVNLATLGGSANNQIATNVVT